MPTLRVKCFIEKDNRVSIVWGNTTAQTGLSFLIFMGSKTIDIEDRLTTSIPCKGFHMKELNFTVHSYGVSPEFEHKRNPIRGV